MSNYETRLAIQTQPQADADQLVREYRDRVLAAIGAYNGVLELYLRRDLPDFDWRDSNSKLEASRKALTTFIRG